MVNRKTENRLGVRFGEFQGVVVSIDDPLKAGRIQIRLYSDNDNKTDCPDDKLFWAHPSSPIQSASTNHKGWSPTGVRVGSTAKGYYADIDKQIGVFSETQYRASIDKPQAGDWTQIASPDNVNDVSPNARGIISAGVQGETNYGGDLFYSSNGVSLYNLATDAGLGPSGSLVPSFAKKMKSGGLPTYGSIPFQSGQKILNIWQQADPQNLSGAIRSSLQGLIALQNITSAAASMGGGDMMSSLFNGILQQATSASSSFSSGGGTPQSQTPLQTNSQTTTPTQANTNTSLIPSTSGGGSTTTPQAQSGSGGSGAQVAQTAQTLVNQLLANAASIPVGVGTQDQSLLNSSQQNKPTQQSGQLPSQGGGGGSGSGLASVASSIISALISAFAGAAGGLDGLADYQPSQGVCIKLREATQQLFSNMADSPNNPGTQNMPTSDSSANTS